MSEPFEINYDVVVYIAAMVWTGGEHCTNDHESTMTEFEADDWVWSSECKSSEIVLSPDQKAAYFHVDTMLESIGTAGMLDI